MPTLTPHATDSETHLILPGRLAPPLVCVSEARRAPGGAVESALHLRDDGIALYRRLIGDPRTLLVIHNAPFDLGVACAEDPALVPPIFDAYAAGRVACTVVLQKLIDVALGMRKFRRRKVDDAVRVTKSSYGLADLVDWYYGERVEKGEDTWRLSYALLEGVPIDRWPSAAREYAVSDAVLHLRVWEAQQRCMAEFGEELPNQIEQQRAAWVLHLMSMWGVRAEAAAVDRFVAHCEEEIAKMRRDLDGTGIFRETGARCMAEIRRRVVASCERLQVLVPMTDPSRSFPEGQVQTDKEALEATDDPALHVLATSMTFAKHLGQWGPVCRAAVLRPVCARYEVLAETGRTACSGSEGQEGTNFQNPPRKGDVRPCFIPRKGWVFCSTDADTIELRAHAQNCLELVGWSRMAEALWDQHRNGGADLHVRLAAAILGITNEEAAALKKAGDIEIALARQFAKIPNFGFPGGLGAETMITYAAGQLDKETHKRWFGVDREEQLSRSKKLRELWFETWPENRDYFKVVGEMIDRDSGEGVVRQLMSGRIRGGCRFTAAANGFFQGRVADAMKEVLWRLAGECYTGRCSTEHAHGGSDLCTASGRSVLHGSRPVMFLHDEPIVEHPEDGSESDRAERQRQIVVESLSRWMPDVPCTSSAVLTRRWLKGAEPIFVNNKLVPCRFEKVTGLDGKQKIKWVPDREIAA